MSHKMKGKLTIASDHAYGMHIAQAFDAHEYQKQHDHQYAISMWRLGITHSLNSCTLCYSILFLACGMTTTRHDRKKGNATIASINKPKRNSE